MQDGVTTVVASVKQDNQGDSRAMIPVVGLVPILGRMFTTPKQSSSQSDIVITVTPHIHRAPAINPTDHLARNGGSQQSGFIQSIEEVLYRAQSQDEQERRLISQQGATAIEPAPTSLLVEATAPSAKPAPATPDKAAATQIFKLLTTPRIESVAAAQPEVK